MAFVLDASAAMACLALEQRADGDVASLMQRLEQDEAIVPAVFMPEMLHVLVKRKRRARGKSKLLDRQVGLIHDMALVVDAGTALYLETRSLPLARAHRLSIFDATYLEFLSIFDATYLELAIRRGLPLATFDHGLIRAAQAERVPFLS